MPYKDSIKNKEYHREYLKKWTEKNRDKIRGYWQKYYYSHQEEITTRKRKQRIKNEQSYQIRARRYHRTKIAVLKKYSNGRPKCACCGESKYEFLSIDHIVPQKGYYKEAGGENLYSKLLKIPTQKKHYQILCYNCNMGKRLNRDCPHKKSQFQTLTEWEQWSKNRQIKTPNKIKKLWQKKF